MLSRAAQVGSFSHSLMTTGQVRESETNFSVMPKDCAFVLENGVNCQTSLSISGTWGFVKCHTVGKQTREQWHQSDVRLNLFHLQMMVEQWCYRLWANELNATMGWNVYIPVANKSICTVAFVKTEIVICRGLGFKEAGLNLVFISGRCLSSFFHWKLYFWIFLCQLG